MAQAFPALAALGASLGAAGTGAGTLGMAAGAGSAVPLAAGAGLGALAGAGTTSAAAKMAAMQELGAASGGGGILGGLGSTAMGMGKQLAQDYAMHQAKGMLGMNPQQPIQTPSMQMSAAPMGQVPQRTASSGSMISPSGQFGPRGPSGDIEDMTDEELAQLFQLLKAKGVA